ncbi:LLM class F420-dependent oxidoreductase [Dactylosporangium sucinum]|uniref:LLM class F420-dependent oxidoreductase n=1 Tax=Dactylosporangium sucinum TaxID=1424081 RepID=A0A917U9Q3_9ACTN|nr:LLM class F420-dependent oxidoreductase [Dactylosporangium sucinum]GGM64387.1 LLM class F420-dependent oxidoreductase [Dactylosporangium sucinum]
MKWSLVFSSTKCPEPDRAAHLARTAEEAGFSTLWAPEHIVVPVRYASAYGFASDGKIQIADEPFPDPLVWLTYVSAVTSRIRLGTGVLILPEHNPVSLAKRTATLAAMSGGRLVLGVGAGWFREEYDALGMDFGTRGARMDESIDVLREIWSQDEAAYSGRHYHFEPLRMYPKPPGRAVPIHVGGDSRVAARRAGRTGDGFFPAMWPTERVRQELPALLEEMRVSARAAGRDPDAIEVTSGGARTAEEAKWYADQGVHQLTVAVRARDEQGIHAELMRFGETVIERTVDL